MTRPAAGRGHRWRGFRLAVRWTAALAGAQAAALAAWAVLGRAALAGRFGAAEQVGWLLLALSVPLLRAVETGAAAAAGDRLAAALRRRLMAALLALPPEACRGDATGRLLGRVLGAEACERLLAAGGPATLVAAMELAGAAAVLAQGAAAAAGLSVLAAAVAAAALLTAACRRRRRACAAWRDRLVGRMIEELAGLRTRRVQGHELRDTSDPTDDAALAAYHRSCRQLGAVEAALCSLVPRAFLIAGLLGLAAAWPHGTGAAAGNGTGGVGGTAVGAVTGASPGGGFGTSAPAAGRLAATLGGLLLGSGALSRMAAAGCEWAAALAAAEAVLPIVAPGRPSVAAALVALARGRGRGQGVGKEEPERAEEQPRRTGPDSGAPRREPDGGTSELQPNGATRAEDTGGGLDKPPPAAAPVREPDGPPDEANAAGLPGQISPAGPAPGAAPCRRPPRLLEVRHLSARIPGHTAPLFSNLKLTLRERDRVLLTGASGAGKSTLAALVAAGLTAPNQPGHPFPDRRRQAGPTSVEALPGSLLLLRGLDPATWGRAAWRRRIVAVPQLHANHLFAESLAFNLLCARGWPPAPADLATAEALCRALGLGALLDRLPRGLDERVGEAGWQLSDGEASRVCLARAAPGSGPPDPRRKPRRPGPGGEAGGAGGAGPVERRADRDRSRGRTVVGQDARGAGPPGARLRGRSDPCVQCALRPEIKSPLHQFSYKQQ